MASRKRFHGPQTRRLGTESSVSTAPSGPAPRKNRPFPTPQLEAMGLPRSSGSGSIEKEYVYNLQQQVYFLELELRLLKERQEALKESRTSEATLEAVAPLEEHIGQLQEKYRAIEVGHKEALKADLEDRLKTQAEAEKLDLELQAQAKEIEWFERTKKDREDLDMLRRKQVVADGEEQAEQTTTLSRRLEHSQQARQASNARRTRDESALRAVTRDVEELEKKVAQLQEKKTSMELEAEQLEKAAEEADASREALEKEGETTGESKAQFREDIDQLLREKWAMERSVRALELKIEETKHLRERTDAEAMKIAEGQVEFQRELETVQSDIRMEVRKKTEKVQMQEKAVAERVQLRQKVHDLAAENKRVEETGLQMEERVRICQEECAARGRDGVKLEAHIEELKQTQQSWEEKVHASSEVNAEWRRQKDSKEHELSAVRLAIEKDTAILESGLQERLGLHVKSARASNYLQVTPKLQSINLHATGETIVAHPDLVERVEKLVEQSQQLPSSIDVVATEEEMEAAKLADHDAALQVIADAAEE